MLSLVACNKPTDNKKSVVKTSEKVSAEDKKTSESSTLTNESKSGTKINVKEKAKQGENKELKLEEFKANDLFYTSYLGIRKVFPNTLPMPLAYQDGKLYYMSDRVPDGISKADLEHALKNSQIGPERKYFGFYDVKTKEKQEMLLADWHLMSVDYATQVLPDNKLLVVYVSNDEQGKIKGIHTKIVVLDFKKQTQTTIAEYETFNGLSKVKKLNEHEYVMLLAIQVDKEKNATKQILLHFNSADNQVTELYRSEEMSENSQDVFAFDCFEEKIYLLMHKLNSGKLTTYLRTIDKQGKQLNEVELTCLAKYESPEQLVEDLFVEKDFIFVEFEAKGPSKGADNEPIAMLRFVEGNYELQNLDNMQIAKIPQVHRKNNEALVMPKYMQDEQKETYQYYAYFPEKNSYDIWDTKLKREQGSHFALNVQNQQLLLFVSDQDANYQYYWAKPIKG